MSVPSTAPGIQDMTTGEGPGDLAGRIVDGEAAPPLSARTALRVGECLALKFHGDCSAIVLPGKRNLWRSISTAGDTGGAITARRYSLSPAERDARCSGLKFPVSRFFSNCILHPRFFSCL